MEASVDRNKEPANKVTRPFGNGGMFYYQPPILLQLQVGRGHLLRLFIHMVLCAGVFLANQFREAVFPNFNLTNNPDSNRGVRREPCERPGW